MSLLKMEHHGLSEADLLADTVLLDFLYAKTNIRPGVSKIDDTHIHNICEIYVHITGDCSFLVEKNLYSLEYGDIIVSMPNERHQCIFHSDTLHEYFCLWISLDGEDTGLLDAIIDRKKGRGNLISMSAHSKEKFLSHCFTLNDKDSKPVTKTASFFSLLDMLERHKHEKKDAVKTKRELEEILDYIEEFYYTDFTVSDLAERFFISRSTITRYFNRYLNTTPTKYIEEKRLSVAKSLIEEGVSLQETCSKCGFPDYSHFIAVFRKKFGITPYQYYKSTVKPFIR